MEIEDLKTDKNGERNLGKLPRPADIIWKSPVSVPIPEDPLN